MEEKKEKDSGYYSKIITKYSIIFLSIAVILIIIPLLLGLAVSTVDPVIFH